MKSKHEKCKVVGFLLNLVKFDTAGVLVLIALLTKSVQQICVMVR